MFHTHGGKTIFKNFLFQICKIKKNWTDKFKVQKIIKDIQTHGLGIISCDALQDDDDNYDDNTFWQYTDKAVEIITNKYSNDEGSKVKALTDLQEYKYVRAMQAKTPYESMSIASPVINATPQDIKDKYRHLPMRR